MTGGFVFMIFGFGYSKIVREIVRWFPVNLSNKISTRFDKIRQDRIIAYNYMPGYTFVIFFLFFILYRKGHSISQGLTRQGYSDLCSVFLVCVWPTSPRASIRVDVQPLRCPVQACIALTLNTTRWTFSTNCRRCMGVALHTLVRSACKSFGVNK